MIMLNCFKLAFLFIGVWMTFVNVAKIIYKRAIPTNNFLLWAIGIVGFITIQFKLYL